LFMLIFARLQLCAGVTNFIDRGGHMGYKKVVKPKKKPKVKK
jgi:hypothetical protein